MLKWVLKLFSKIFIVTGALIASQMPLFMQYYSQQLAGRVSELGWQIEGMEQMATQTGKNLDQYIQKFISNPDTDFQLQGQLMKETQTRWFYLKESIASLQQATAWSKPFIFLQRLDLKIAHSTLNSYKPGMTLNMEGMIYVLGGMGIGAFCYFILCQSVALLYKLIFKKSPINENIQGNFIKE